MLYLNLHIHIKSIMKCILYTWYCVMHTFRGKFPNMLDASLADSSETHRLDQSLTADVNTSIHISHWDLKMVSWWFCFLNYWLAHSLMECDERRGDVRMHTHKVWTCCEHGFRKPDDLFDCRLSFLFLSILSLFSPFSRFLSSSHIFSRSLTHSQTSLCCSGDPKISPLFSPNLTTMGVFERLERGP